MTRSDKLAEIMVVDTLAELLAKLGSVAIVDTEAVMVGAVPTAEADGVRPKEMVAVVPAVIPLVLVNDNAPVPASKELLQLAGILIGVYVAGFKPAGTDACTTVLNDVLGPVLVTRMVYVTC